jgi:hypothetical protein
LGDSFEKVQYTFMEYNSKVLNNLPDGKGDDFPAFLTYRAAVDKWIVNLERPCMTKESNLRPCRRGYCWSFIRNGIMMITLKVRATFMQEEATIRHSYS